MRSLLARMLHRDPHQRPKDLVALAEMIRECLLKIERRGALAEKYGIPYRTTMPRRTKAPPKRFLRVALPIVAMLLAVGVIAAVLLPEPISRLVHRFRETKPIGVLVGVPESSPPAAVQNALTTTAPATVTSQGGGAAVPPASQPSVNVATVSNSPQVSSPDLQQSQTSNAQSQVAAANASGASSLGATRDSSSSSGGETTLSSRANEAPQPASTSQTTSPSKKKRSASTLQGRGASAHAQMVGITSDGRLIYRLPSGGTRVVAPDSEEEQFMPRGRRRVLIERDEETFVPPPRFAPDYFPDD